MEGLMQFTLLVTIAETQDNRSIATSLILDLKHMVSLWGANTQNNYNRSKIAIFTDHTND